MGNVTVVGAQWGDEGKGKIVDWLSSRADVVVRFQGGHNAGHTLVVDGVEYKLSLLPAGVVRGGKLSVIGNGVVVDPWALLAEIDTMVAKGVSREPGDADDRGERLPHPADPPRARPGAGEGAWRRQARHHGPRHRPGLRGQGRAPRNSPLRSCATWRRSGPGSASCCSTTTR